MADNTRNRSSDSGSEQEIEVPFTDWKPFLNGFSQKHDKWIATVEVSGAKGEPEVEVRDRPFSGASYDEPGTGETRIIIGLSDEDPANHLDHSVINPTRLCLIGNNADDIKIYSVDGSITLVRFSRAVDPGKPSGVAA